MQLERKLKIVELIQRLFVSHKHMKNSELFVSCDFAEGYQFELLGQNQNIIRCQSISIRKNNLTLIYAFKTNSACLIRSYAERLL